MKIDFFLLSLFALLFLVRYVVHLVREYRKTEDKRCFWSFRRFRYGIMLALVVGIPLLLVNLLFPFLLPEPLHPMHTISMVTIWWIAVPVSLLISLGWLIFMYRLDIFERRNGSTCSSLFYLPALWRGFPVVGCIAGLKCKASI